MLFSGDSGGRLPCIFFWKHHLVQPKVRPPSVVPGGNGFGRSHRFRHGRRGPMWTYGFWFLQGGPLLLLVINRVITYKCPYIWVTGIITIVTGVITPLITGVLANLVWCFVPVFCWKNNMLLFLRGLRKGARQVERWKMLSNFER